MKKDYNTVFSAQRTKSSRGLFMFTFYCTHSGKVIEYCSCDFCFHGLVHQHCGYDLSHERLKQILWMLLVPLFAAAVPVTRVLFTALCRNVAFSRLIHSSKAIMLHCEA